MIKARLLAFAFAFLAAPIALFAQAKPDLVVSGAVTASPNPAAPGGTVHVLFSILNQGTASAGTTTTRIQIKRNSDNATFADQDFFTASLSAGATLGENCSLVLSSSATGGAYTIYITLDRYSAIVQSNTANDYGSGPFTVSAPLPDIVVSGAVTGSPNPASAGSSVNVSFTVYNQGSATAGQTTSRVQIKRNSDNATFADQDCTTASIGPGQSLSKTCGVTLSPSATNGSYTIYITLDRYSAIVQSNTANDYGSGAFSVSVGSPTITSISPNSGSTTGGTIVTIFGTNLKSASSVTFGGVAGTVAYNATTGDLQPTTPAHSAGSVNVTVTTPGGTVTSTNGYTYVGSTGTLTGTVRDSTTNAVVSGASVSFNGATTTTNSSGVYTLSVACGTSTISVSKTGYNNAQISYTLSNCPGTSTRDVTLIPIPTISSISPNSGSTAGGDRVTIYGTGLQSASSVTFGGAAATIAYNATTGDLQPTTPAHAAGAVNVTVTTPGGTITSTNGYTYVTSKALSFIQVTSGPSQVNENSTAQYICTATYTDGSTANVTNSATWSINTTYASISAGFLTTLAVPSDQACQISVSYGGQSALANITIKNVSIACTFTFNTYNVTLPAAGGSTAIQVTASAPSCAWTPATGSGGTWLSLSPTTQQTGNGTITVSAPANPSSVNQRGTTVTVGNATASITQPASPTTCTYTLSPTAQTMPAAGGMLLFQLTASNQTCAWTALLASGSWASVTGGGNGTGNGTITVAAQANPSTTAPRTTTLSVGSASATITQPASTAVPCSFTLNNSTFTLPAAGGSGTIQVTASNSGCAWTPSKASTGTWLTMSPTALQTGSGTVSFSAPANPSTVSPRETTITVGNATATITQLASSSTGAPIIDTFRTTPDAISLGGTATLSWSVRNASSIVLPPFGNVPATSSAPVSPAVTTTYSLTATNQAGSATANVLVRVDPQLVVVVQGAPLKGSAPLDTNLTANATGGVPPYSYHWSTGENGATTTHRWLTAGQFDVYCAVTDAHGTTTKSSALQVNVSNPSTTTSLDTFDGSTDFQGVPRSKAAADGATTIELRLTASAPAMVTFRLSQGTAGLERDGGLVPYRSTSSNVASSVTVHTTATGDGHHVAAITYLTPRDFNGAVTSTDAERTITFSAHLALDNGASQDASPRTFTLVRPPLVFIHGIWSGSSPWSNFPLSHDTRFFIAQTEWDGVSSINTAKARVGDSIYNVLTTMRSKNIAASRVDIIAHSMGGLLARAWYADGHDVVHKLITLNTPHYGSQWANVIDVLNGVPGIPYLAEKAGYAIDKGAITDLKVNSPALKALGGTNLSSHTFVGYASLSEPCATTPTFIIGLLCTFPALISSGAGLETWSICVLQAPTAVLGEANDEIVGVTSQRGGAQGSAVDDVMGCTSAHTTVTSNRGTFQAGSTTPGVSYTDRVFALINTPVTDPVFGHLSASAAQTSAEAVVTPPSRVMVPASLSGSLTVDSPKIGDVLEPGQPFKVSVSAPPELTSVTLLTPRESIAVSGPPFEHTFIAPLDAAGVYSVSAVARKDATAYTANPVDVSIVPTGTLLSLTIDPLELFMTAGGQYALKVDGYFGDGLTRDVTEAGPMYASSNSSVVAVDDHGHVTAIRAGSAIIDIQYRGVSGHVLVTVVAPPRRRAVNH